MSEREQFIRENINIRRQQIADGVSAEKEDRLQKEIEDFESELRQLLTDQEQSVVRIEEERQQAISVLDNVDGLPLESYTTSEDAAVLIRCEVESLVVNLGKKSDEREAKLREELRAAGEREIIVRRQNAELQEKIDETQAAYDKLFKENAVLAANLEAEERLRKQAEFERDEALKNRDNAASEIEDLRKELESLKTGKIMTDEERTAVEEEARRRFLETRIKITNRRWEDEYRKTHYLAELAETGETIRFGYLQHGKYLEVTAEEAESFRQSLTAQNVAAEDIPVPETVESPTFAGDDFRPEVEPIQEIQLGADETDYGDQEPGMGTDAEKEALTEEVGETWEDWVERQIANLIFRVSNIDYIANNAADIPPKREAA